MVTTGHARTRTRKPTARVYTVTHPDGTASQAVCAPGQTITGAYVAELAEPDRPTVWLHRRADAHDLTADHLYRTARDPRPVVTLTATGDRIAYAESEPDLRVPVDASGNVYHTVTDESGTYVRRMRAAKALSGLASSEAHRCRVKADELRQQARREAENAPHYAVVHWLRPDAPAKLPNRDRVSWEAAGYVLRKVRVDDPEGEPFDAARHAGVMTLPDAPKPR